MSDPAPISRRGSSLDDANGHNFDTKEDHDFTGASVLPSDLSRQNTWSLPIMRRTSTFRAPPINEESNGETQSAEDTSKAEVTDDSPVSTTAPASSLSQKVPAEETSQEPTQEEKAIAKSSTRKGMRKVRWLFIKEFLIIFVAFIGILSIYWGSWYDRRENMHRLSYLVALDEAGEAQSLISDTIREVFQSREARTIGTFHFPNMTEFRELAEQNNRSTWDEVVHRVHQQYHWGGIYVPRNATASYLESLRTLRPYNDTVRFVYETARSPTSVGSYVVIPIRRVQNGFVQQSQRSVVSPLVETLSDDEYHSLMTNGTDLLSSLWFTMIDNRAYDFPGLIGPILIGLIYLVVISFHQFNFASDTHELMQTKLRLKDYVVYHMITSHVSYLVISLTYCLMILAFQMPYTRTFGRSGFLVCWAFVYLTTAAFGGANENAALQIFARNKPLIGLWIVLFMVANLAPVFSPMALTNRFYRYGYAMPMHCGNELLTVALLNTTKRHVGWNIAILIAWILVTNAILPFNLRNIKNYKRGVEEKARLALESQRQAQKS